MPQSRSPRRDDSRDDRRHRHRDHDRRTRDVRKPRSRSRDRALRRSASLDGHGQRRYDERRSQSPRSRRSPESSKRPRGTLPSQADAFNTTKGVPSPPATEKQKPNFRPSGLLAAAANTVSTSAGAVVLKYHEPPEARKPPSSQPWRLYIFKGESIVDTLDLYAQSCWLFGREASVCDYALEHPSCSKQHAVIQFRYVERRNEFGDKIGKVKPYVIDLESANGTMVNDEAVPEGRFVELRDKDIIKFGHSSREYVMQMPPE
ncbi:uncharacterized protein Z520_11992 [Fonsecaea multimorphosa CBS 102226]|uniref:FHA domain-containing protein n=1 Tax=Fonsecaea multimorphosa CBS 102226 TaxID=1442371 RepID=A0A0D2I4Q6_9EURO|nr:uncharacterized protein Z520_11992 [Fonsecaea multimorphosa CBS 102226]KIX92246.1 hypothetical protein Z520_11992 [Fonsecaea multimorphosa CBS 102226]OAL17622.1 hypothetical protein AYO22_11412 [Fonsecaea multimorphosa]